MEGQTKGSYFIQALQSSFQKHNLELWKLGDIVTDGMLSLLMVWSLLYKHIHKLGLQN